MLTQLQTVRLLVFRLNKRLYTWEMENPKRIRTARAIERMDYVRECLKDILSLINETVEAAPAIEVEATQLDPRLWATVEDSLVSIYRQDPKVDGVLILIQKARAKDMVSPNYARIVQSATLEDRII